MATKSTAVVTTASPSSTSAQGSAIAFAPSPSVLANIATYAQQVEIASSSQEFPALQATQYTNLARGQSIPLGFNAGSVDILTDAAQVQLGLEASTAVFNGKSEFIAVITTNIQWVVLTYPRKDYIYHRELRKTARQPQGYQLQSGTKIVSAAKMLLAAFIPSPEGGEFIRDSDGGIQVFTLNLRSIGCNIIGNQDADHGAAKNAGYHTLTGLNAMLAKAYGVDPKSWWTHLAAITIGAVGLEREKKDKSEKSVTATIVLATPATPLPPALCEEVAAWISSEPMQALFADPFRLDRAIAAYDGPDPFLSSGAADSADTEAF
jgi:hypothetical protein